ncbi:MAG: hypothetical protein IKE24_03640, partial [Clostridia bacterium]|nr:hypothetical protein [Clostridia bacterium]
MSTYSIYLDETGDFQGNEGFYAICGFVWKGDALNLKEWMISRKLCTTHIGKESDFIHRYFLYDTAIRSMNCFPMRCLAICKL